MLVGHEIVLKLLILDYVTQTPKLTPLAYILHYIQPNRQHQLSVACQVKSLHRHTAVLPLDKRAVHWGNSVLPQSLPFIIACSSCYLIHESTQKHPKANLHFVSGAHWARVPSWIVFSVTSSPTPLSHRPPPTQRPPAQPHLAHHSAPVWSSASLPGHSRRSWPADRASLVNRRHRA